MPHLTRAWRYINSKTSAREPSPSRQRSLVSREAKLPRKHNLPGAVAPDDAALLDLESFTDMPGNADSAFGQIRAGRARPSAGKCAGLPMNAARSQGVDPIRAQIELVI